MLQFKDMLNESIYDADFKKFYSGIDFSKSHKVSKDTPRVFDIHITDITVDVRVEGQEDTDAKQVNDIFKKYKFPLEVDQEYSYGTVITNYEFVNGKSISIESDFYYDSKSKKTLIFTSRNRKTEYYLIG